MQRGRLNLLIRWKFMRHQPQLKVEVLHVTTIDRPHFYFICIILIFIVVICFGDTLCNDHCSGFHFTSHGTKLWCSVLSN